MTATETHTKTTTRLFKATSVIDNWPYRNGKYDGVQVAWVAWDRGRFPGQYRDLITDYGVPDGCDASLSESLVDELFTAEEVQALCRYFAARDVEVDVAEVDLPIRSRDDDGVELAGLISTTFGRGRDAYMLWKHEDYDLPLKVVGVFDVWGQHPAPQVHEKLWYTNDAQRVRDTAVRFWQKVHREGLCRHTDGMAWVECEALEDALDCGGNLDTPLRDLLGTPTVESDR